VSLHAFELTLKILAVEVAEGLFDETVGEC
jgi:hypothetical protein